MAVLKNVSTELHDLKFKSKREFYSKVFSNCHCAKKKWKILSSLMGNTMRNDYIKQLNFNGTSINQSQDIVNALNNSFVTSGQNLANSIPSFPTDNINHFNLVFYNNTSIFLNPSDTSEIFNFISAIETSKASGHDGLNAAFVKACIVPNSIFLSELINKCFESGTFPSALKIARIVAVHKGGSKSDINNYRPISILSLFSKIIEKCIYNRFFKFLDSSKFFTSFQYGFRSNSNTSSALTDILSFITNSVDKGNVFGGLFIDLKKAFDTIDRGILPYKA
jgi:hypothetical protein